MVLSHLKVKTEDISPYILLPGDPARVDLIGQKLDNFKILGQNREFRVGSGKYQGTEITVCSTGIGGPSTAIAVEELISAGAKILIRVGTCGGAWREEIKPGSLIIPTAAIRDEGTTQEYIPPAFPAVADFKVVEALIKSAKKNLQKYYVGINRTHDAFYGPQKSIKKWGGYLLDERWENAVTPILSSDMETAILFIVACLRGVCSGAVLAVNAEPEPLKQRIIGKSQKVQTEDGAEITAKTAEVAILVSLDALAILSKEKI